MVSLSLQRVRIVRQKVGERADVAVVGPDWWAQKWLTIVLVSSCNSLVDYDSLHPFHSIYNLYWPNDEWTLSFLPLCVMNPKLHLCISFFDSNESQRIKICIFHDYPLAKTIWIHFNTKLFGVNYVHFRFTFWEEWHLSNHTKQVGILIGSLFFSPH